jgi:hypothetical protein
MGNQKSKMKIDDNYFTSGIGKHIRASLELPPSPTANRGVASGMINKKVLDKVYGTSDEFLTRYEGFQQRYLRMLETELDPRAAGRANLEILKSQGKIDLSVLNKTVRDQMRQEYINDILRLPRILKEAGLPNINLPSANLYRQLFRYQVDTSSGNPGAMLLNSILLNVNPEKVGLEAFNVGTSNIAGLRTVKQTAKNDLASLLSGKKVYTFDVETAGIFEGAQTRSMAIAEMTAGGKISVLPDYNLSYASKQMGGLNVSTMTGGSKSMSEFLSGGTKIIQHGTNGEGFLDESAKFLNKLMEAEVVAGHNINFDINALFNTMQQMGAYNKHEGAQKAIAMFTKRMTDEENFIVDTLQYSRTYLNDKINAKLATAVGTDAKELSRFRDLLYSDDFMAKIHFGGSTGTSSVEAIAANTNLLQLLEQDMISGDAGAKELFEKIYSGTHIADTDSFLQSYFANTQISNKLDVVDSATRSRYSDLVKGAQRKILGSAAVTPTTNIASVSNLSEQVFNSLIDPTDTRGMRGVKLRTSISGLGEGLLQFDSQEGVYKFAVGQTTSNIPQLDAEKIIRTNLMDARAGTLSQLSGLPGVMVNQSDLNIIDLGINYTQAHQIDEVTNLQKTLGKVTASANETTLMARLGQTYSLFGSDPETTADAINIARGRSSLGGHFSVGLEDYTARAPGAVDQFATAAQKAADPYAFLDVRSRVFSTIMADASTPYIERAKAAALANGTMDAMRYADYGDIMSEFGVSHFKGVENFSSVYSGFGGQSVLKENIFIPLSAMEKAAERSAIPRVTNLLTTGQVSLSYATRNNADNVMNAMFHLAKGTSKDDARNLVSSLFDLAEEAHGANAAKLGFEADVLKQLAQFHTETGGVLNASKLTKDDLIDQFTERLTSGRIGIASIEGEAADQAYLALKRAGDDVANDVVTRRKLGRIIDTVGGGKVVRIAPFVDEEVAARAGLEGSLDSARGSIIDFLNESADILAQGNNATKARNQIRRAKLGQAPNKMLEFYINNKTKMGIAGLAVGAVGLGYMAAKKYREHSLYDETIQQQPTSRMSTGQMMNQSAPVSSTINSYRRDPLVTAGVVGNLDRNKVNHYKMGNDKYNHLFGG